MAAQYINMRYPNTSYQDQNHLKHWYFNKITICGRWHFHLIKQEFKQMSFMKAEYPKSTTIFTTNMIAYSSKISLFFFK